MQIILKPVDFFIGKRQLILFLMRVLIFLCCVMAFSLTPSSAISQNSKIRIEADMELTVDQVFDLIMRQTVYSFVYEESIFKNSQKINVKRGNVRPLKLLQESLANGNYRIIVTTNNNIIIKENTGANRRLQKQVSGKVTNEQGMPLAGVTVQIKGTTKGTITDFDGAFTITVPDPANVLVFSSLGFETQERIVKNQSTIDVMLKESIDELNEVVVKGYYNTTPKVNTGNVSSIKAKTIEKQPVNNPIAAIQGHMPGVNIRQTTGVPGGGYEIDIRGRHFLSGTPNPLFIVDGVPYGGESLEGFVGRSINDMNVSPLNAINPADIASIEVLKDADATAIYGSRGANGVVLITTKQGKAGKTKFSVNVSTTLGQVTRLKQLLNTPQYLELRREGIINLGLGSQLDDPAFDSSFPELKLWSQDRYTDWQKVLIGGTAYRNNAQLALSGGNNQTQFLVSGGYQNETTVFPGDSKYIKGSLRSNISHQSNDQRFNINLSTSYTIEDNKLPFEDFTNLANNVLPNAPALYNEDGNLNWENGTFDNPLANLEREYQAKTNTFISNMVLSYELQANLKLKANLGYNTYQLESYSTVPHTSYNPNLNYNSGRSFINLNNGKRQSWIVEPQLHWQKTSGDINLSCFVGGTFQRQTTQQLTQRAMGFPSNILIHNITAAESIEVFQDSESEYAYQAVFGRININYKERYILNLTGRRDGSSRFGPGRRYGNFGAIGAAWIFSEEIFLQDSDILSFGKLRGSYGVTGSDNIPDYGFLDTYDITGFDYNNIMVLEPTGIFNPIYAWEENKKLELALELGLFKDRIRLNTAWYQNRSANQLIGIPLAATTGFDSLTGNFDATVENMGLELDLRTTNIDGEHFRWSTIFNITVPRNKLLKFPNLENSAFANRYRVGKPLTEIGLFHALGVDPDTGFYQFEDYNNDGNITRLDDRLWFEDFAPKFYGGFGNTLSYKNLSLDLFFQFKKQRNFNFFRTDSGAGLSQNGVVQLMDRWQQPGDMALIQKAGFSSNNQSLSSAAVSDASFIRLRNATLNYKIPMARSNDMDINFYIQGQNLLTITNYDGADPEEPLSRILPPLRQITLGVQLSF